MDQLVRCPVKQDTDKNNREDTGEGDGGAAAGSAGIDDEADAVPRIDLFANGNVCPTDAVHHGEGLQDIRQGAGQQDPSQKLDAIHAEGAGCQNQFRADGLKGKDDAWKHIDKTRQEQKRNFHTLSYAEPEDQQRIESRDGQEPHKIGERQNHTAGGFGVEYKHPQRKADGGGENTGGGDAAERVGETAQKLTVLEKRNKFMQDAGGTGDKDRGHLPAGKLPDGQHKHGQQKRKFNFLH